MKSAKEVWSFVKPYIGKYYLAFLLGGVFWMLLDVYATKGIDASFVSACADVSLVVAAVIAGFEAKKAWVKRTKEDGYKIATILMNDKLIKTVYSHELVYWNFSMGSLLRKYLTLDADLEFRNIEYKKSRERVYIKELIGLRDKLKGFHKDKLYNLSQEIHFEIFRMRNVGVNFSTDDDGEKLRGYFNRFRDLSIKCEGLIVSMDSYIDCYTDIKGDVIVIDDFKNYRFHLETIDSSYHDVRLMTDSLRETFNEFTKYSQTKSVLNYFNLN
ncbi:hypothetical protein ERHA55_29380 [Erwinia rhapontici]|uniref:Phage abortive infection protein n=1 Tax=Erwinia rhapontici TaxID=55212 RepID=A0ABN6DN21_ERWRD|nr:hypothetical protein [Erwinia rhapontici]BCQ35268.1 hypothetical protein ERHA53_26110 [Erwinia rhapontici]BCQ45411.1 hypothetical protein ERHA55_29380 [Erwinia rhapontici]